MTYNHASSAFSADSTAPNSSSETTVLDGDSGSSLHIPGGNFLLTAEFHRVGGDLLLTGDGGHDVVVQGYFNSHTPPDLISGSGGVISGDLAAKLAGPVAPGQYALDGNAAPDSHAIGQVQNLSGTVTVHHANGVSETLHQGSTVFQGDVMQTAADGTVGLVFADRSTFSLGKNGRMVMDEMVYDPQAHNGHSTMSVVQGTFSFVSGQIAKSAPDAMHVKTPVMTIGIRGTTVAGVAAAEGSQNTVALLSDADGGVGQIIISTQGGPPQVMTIPNQSIQISSAFEAPPPLVILRPDQLHQIMPDLHNVQDHRPPPPPSDPHITGSNEPNGTAPTITDPNHPTGTGDHVVAGLTGDHPTLAMPEVNDVLDQAVAQTTQALQLVNNAVSVALHSSDNTGSTGSGSHLATQGSSSTVLNNVVSVQLTSTLSLEPTSSSTATTTTSGGHGYDYTLSGGDDVTTYAEALSAATVDIALNDTNWTVLANSYAATVALPVSSVAADHSGHDVIYAGSATSGSDSANPTLSLADDSHGVTLTLSSVSANNQSYILAHTDGSSYVKEADAYGFHHFVMGSGSDQVNWSGGDNLTIDGGSGSDTLSLHDATHAMTVDMTGGSASATNVLSELNFESVIGTSFNDTFLGSHGVVAIDGGSGTDVVSYAALTGGVTAELDGSCTAQTLVGGVSHLYNIESVIGSSGGDLFIESSEHLSALTIDGGAGADTLSLAQLTDTSLTVHVTGASSSGVTGYNVTGDSTLDLFSNMDKIVGTSLADTFIVGHGAIDSFSGTVALDGGAGRDVLSFDTATGLTIAVSGTSGTASGINLSVSFQNFETVAGGLGADTITVTGGGTHTLLASSVTQADVTALADSTPVTSNVIYDDTDTQITANTFQAVGGSGHWVVFDRSEAIDDNAYSGTYEVAYRGYLASGATALTSVELVSPHWSATGDVGTLVLSDNGQHAAYAAYNYVSDESEVYFYDINTGRTVHLTGGSNDTTGSEGSPALAINNDGSLVAYSTANGIALVNTRTDHEVGSILANNPVTMKFANDGQELIAQDSYNFLNFYSVSDDGRSLSLTSSVENVKAGEWAVSSSGDVVVYATGNSLWEISGGSSHLLTTADSSIDQCSVSANGRFVSYWQNGQTLVLCDLASNTTTALQTLGASADLSGASITMSDDGHYVFVSESTGVVDFVNPYFTNDTAYNTLTAGTGLDTLIGGAALQNADVVSDTAGGTAAFHAGNTLIGGSGTTVMEGGGGSTRFIVGSGEETIIGGGLATDQVLDLSGVTANVYVDLRSTMMDPTAHELVVGSTVDYIAGIGNVVGGAGSNNTLVGNQNANTIIAGTGEHTTIIGHGGADQIYFGAHTNVLEFTDNYHAETVYLDDVSTAVNELTASGMNGGMESVTRSGNDLVFHFTAEGGGGSTVFKNYFTTSHSSLVMIDGAGIDGSNEIISKNTTGTLGSYVVDGTTGSLHALVGTTGDDLLIGATDNMLILGSTGILTGAVAGSEDVFVQGTHDLIVTSSDSSSIYFNTLNDSGASITANLSIQDTHVLSGHTFAMQTVTYEGATTYLYGANEIIGTNNGDVLEGGLYSTTEVTTYSDISFCVGTGSNKIANANYVARDSSGATVYLDGVKQSDTYHYNVDVDVDYSRSAGGIVANLNSNTNSGGTITVALDSNSTGHQTEEINCTGTVVHDGVTDYLYGVTNIRGSAFDDNITGSAEGSYIRSSKGNDTYQTEGNYTSLDYDDSSSAVAVNLSGSDQTFVWTYSDGITVSQDLAAGRALHDYSGGSAYTDTLYGSVNDIRMSEYGGTLVGTGWNDESVGATTLDLQDLKTGVTVDMVHDLAYGWKTGSTIAFSQVAAIEGTSSADTFILNDSSNPLSIIGNGGADVLDLSRIGYHTVTAEEVSYNHGNSHVEYSGISSVLGENILDTVGSTAVLTLASNHGRAAFDMTTGVIRYQDGTIQSVQGSESDVDGASSIIASASGALFYGNTADLMSHDTLVGGTGSVYGSMEIADNVYWFSDDSFFGTVSNIGTLQLDGSSATASLDSYAITAGVSVVAMDQAHLASSSISTTMGTATLDVGGQDGSVSLTDSVWSNYAGFSKLVIGTEVIATDTTFQLDSVSVALGNNAWIEGIRTVDLSQVRGNALVTLSSYDSAGVTVLGGSGYDTYNVLTGTGSYTIDDGSHAKVVMSGAQSAYTASVSSGHVQLTDGSETVTLEGGVSKVQFADTTTWVVAAGTNDTTLSMSVDAGSTDALWLIGGYSLTSNGTLGTATLSVDPDQTDTKLASYVAGTTTGEDTLILSDGTNLHTVHLSIGYEAKYEGEGFNPGFSGDMILRAGSHLNVDISGVGAAVHNAAWEFVNSGGFTAGGDFNAIVAVGSAANGDTAASLNVLTGLTADLGSFAHINGLDSYASDNEALQLVFSNDSVALAVHSAISSTSSSLICSNADDYILGGHGNQTLSGGGGADEILAVSGNDTVIVGDNRFAYLDGGSGESQLQFAFTKAAKINLTGSGVEADTTATGGVHRSDSVEHFDLLDLTNSQGSTLTLNEAALYSASKDVNGLITASNAALTGNVSSSHALIIGGVAGDSVNLTHASTAWTHDASTVTLSVNGVNSSYQVYHTTYDGHAETVYVDQHVTVHAA